VDDSEPEEGFLLIDDLATADLFVVEPHDLRERFLTAGFRSGLVVLTRARYQRLGLSFWSQHPRAFSRENLPEARRIADHVALAVSHERLAAAARQVAEAHARAEWLEARVKSLTAGLPKGTGVSPECREGRRVGEGTERH
jgi:GAF domain-containing protein